MTKTMKKSLIAVLVLVMALACGMFAMNAPVAKADSTETEFTTHVVTKLKNNSGVYDETLFANETYVSDVKLAQDMSTVGASAEAMEIWSKVLTVFSEPLSLETWVTSDLVGKVKGFSDRLYYSDNANLVKYEALWAKYSAETVPGTKDYPNTYAYLNDVEAFVTTLTTARTMMNEIEVRVNTAIVAINNIEYFVTDAMAAGDTSGIVVLNSQTSIGYKFDAATLEGVADNTAGATKALYDIYNLDFTTVADKEAATLGAGVYEVYTTAIKDLNEQYAKAVAVINAISNLKDNVISADVCYTMEDEVQKVRDDYDNLKNVDAAIDTSSVNQNDLQTLVNNFAELIAIEDRIRDIEIAIDSVEGLISAIENPAVYTAVCLENIEAAEVAFAALDKDIRDNDTTEGVELIVSNYDVLVKARNDYDALQAQVDEAIASINGLKAKEADTNFYAEWLETEKLYKALNAEDEQKSTVDATAATHDTVTSIATINDLYVYFQYKANAILAKVLPIVNAISNLGPVTITTDYSNALTDIANMLAKLNEQELAAVSNIEEYNTKKAEFERLTAAAQNWVAAVDAIEVPVTWTNKDLVTAATEKYALLNAEVKTLVETATEYAESWTKYTDALNAVAALQTKLDNLIAAMRALDTTAIEITDTFADDIFAFDAAVTPVKTEYEGLAGDTAAQEYIQAETDAYNNYLAALVNYAQYHVEALIVEIGPLNAIKIAKAEVIDKANKAYGLLDEATKEKVRNYATLEESNQDPNLVDALVAIADITAELDAWIAEVEDIATADTVDALVSVDLAKVVKLNQQYKVLVNGDVNVETYIANNGNAKALLEDIEAKAYTLITDLTDKLETIVGETTKEDFEITSDFIGNLEKAEAAYNALDDTQKDLTYDNENGDIYKLLNAYGMFAEVYRYQKLVTDYAAAVDTLYNITIYGDDQYVSENVPVMISTLKSIYEFSGEYQEVLQPSYDTLLEIEAWVEENWEINDIYGEGVVTFEDKVLDQINELQLILYGQPFAGVQGLVSQMQALVGFDYVVDDNGTPDFPWDDTTEHVNGIIDDINDQIAEMETTIANLEDFAQVTGDNVMNLTNGLRQQITSLNELKAAYAEKVEEIETAITNITQDIFNLTEGLTQYKGEVAGKFNEVGDALDNVATDIRNITEGLTDYKGEVAGKFEEVYDALDNITTDIRNITEGLTEYKGEVSTKFEEVDGALDNITTDIRNITEGITQFKGEVATMKTELEEAIAAEKTAREEADAAEKTAREEADTALNGKVDANDKEVKDLLAAQVKKLNTTITIITVIFSVVMAGMIACTVILFLKKR